MFADALPDQPGAADLEEGGQDEEGGGAGDQHAVTFACGGCGGWVVLGAVGCHLMEGAWPGASVGYIS